MRVRDGVANCREGVHKRDELQRFCGTLRSVLVILLRSFRKRASFDKSHGIERPLLRLSAVFVYRYDAGMLELARDPRFPLKASPNGAIVRHF